MRVLVTRAVFFLSILSMACGQMSNTDAGSGGGAGGGASGGGVGGAGATGGGATGGGTGGGGKTTREGRGAFPIHA